MKVNEFVKKFGWDKAKEVASFTSNVCADPTHFDSDLDIYIHFDDFKGVMDESDVCIADLKRLVDSHELVEYCHGIDEAKELLEMIESDKWCYNLLTNTCVAVEYAPSAELSIHYNDLKQAIADVESCK